MVSTGLEQGQVLPREKNVDAFEVEHTFPDLGARVMLVDATRLDHLDLILLSIEDVTQQRDGEKRKERLMREQNHRTKNLITNVQSIAWQTIRHSPSLDAFQDTFFERLQVLARCQDVLVDGHGASVPVPDLLTGALAPHAHSDHIHMDVDLQDVALSGSAALALALAFHELATNAVKYGALSADSGCVEITGRSVGEGDGPSWTLVWRERGGPEVRVPDRTGFGNELITACVRQDLRGTVSFDFAPEGLTVEITAPMG